MTTDIEKELSSHFRQTAKDNNHSLQDALKVSIIDYIKEYRVKK